MNLTLARQFVEEALENGLQLHGISVSGHPAISFDPLNPRAEEARRIFQSTEGLVRDLLRAAMIEHCQKQELPAELDSTQARADLRREMEQAQVTH
nr:hypothetical protein [Oceanococcus sp. HetDA_MAG_MS8]